MKAQDFLEIPPVDFHQVISKLTSDERYELFHECENLAVAYEERAAYVESRYGMGGGDQGHNASVKALNRVRKAVKKAFGYNTTLPINF